MKLDKISIQNGFNKAASTYDMAAIAQKEIGRRLISRLNYLKLKPKNILDLGCGNGYFTNELQNIYPYAKVYGLDFADKALVIAKEKYSKIEFIHADMDDFYAKEEKFDLIFSNLTMQWSQDVSLLLKNLANLLTADGIILFTTLGPDTFKELRSAWQQVDDENDHVNDFIDMHIIGDILLKQFRDPVMDTEHLTLTYKNVLQILKDIKKTGTVNYLLTRRNTLTGKNRFQKMQIAYKDLFLDENNKYPLTYEIIYGYALKKTEQENAKGPYRLSLEQMQAMLGVT